jgi:hypothetical protein
MAKGSSSRGFFERLADLNEVKTSDNQRNAEQVGEVVDDYRIAMAMGRSRMESRMRWKVHVRFGEERQGNSSTTPCLLLH